MRKYSERSYTGCVREDHTPMLCMAKDVHVMPYLSPSFQTTPFGLSGKEPLHSACHYTHAYCKTICTNRMDITEVICIKLWNTTPKCQETDLFCHIRYKLYHELFFITFNVFLLAYRSQLIGPMELKLIKIPVVMYSRNVL